MKKKNLVIGTRGSALALRQARLVASALESSCGETVELQVITTKGDRILDRPLSEIGSKGLFVKEIESALLSGAIDLAVHSMKDMPVELPEGLLIAGTLKREDPRDAFISIQYKNLAEVPDGSRIATGSLRRRAQLLHRRPGLRVVDIRGNVDTRLRKLEEGAAEGLLMAVAGLVRLGLHGSLTEILDTGLMMPAVGQGALALEIREDDGHVRELIDRITCHEDFMALRAERALLGSLEGGCLVPLGALATVHEGVIHLHAVIAAPDGGARLSFSGSGPLGSPEDLGRRVAGGLVGLGGAKIIDEIRKGHE